MALKADDQSLQGIFEGQHRHVAPLYQREYVWDEASQWEPLWEELAQMVLDLCENRSGHPDYYLGAIVLQQADGGYGDLARWDIIDGQQRLITCQIILTVVRDVTAEKQRARVDKTYEDMLAFLQNRLAVLTVNQTARPDSDQRFKVWPTKSDQPIFRKLLTPATRAQLEAENPLPKQSRPRLFEAYLFFRKKLTDFLNDHANGDPHEEARLLESVLKVLADVVKCVVIKIGREDDPQIIFESLNGRPTPLRVSDLIKNHVLRTIPDSEADIAYREFWEEFDAGPEPENDDGDESKDRAQSAVGFWKTRQKQGRFKKPRIDLFFMHFLQFIRKREVTERDLFRTFTEWWKQPDAWKTKLTKIKKCADQYKRFLTERGRYGEARFFETLERLDTTVVYPVLFELLIQARETGQLVEQDLPEMFRDLESYLIRRLISRREKRKYNYVFTSLVHDLQGCQKIDAATLRGMLLEFEGNSVDWPDDSDFREAFVNDAVADGLVPDSQIKYVLLTLDRHLQPEKGEPITVHYDALQLEHLMPQKWREHWPLSNGNQTTTFRGKQMTFSELRDQYVHTMGNLTLLSGTLNPSISNGPWESKRKGISEQSLLMLNARFRDFAAWDEAAIRERATVLFEMARMLWPSAHDRRQEAWTAST